MDQRSLSDTNPLALPPKGSQPFGWGLRKSGRRTPPRFQGSVTKKGVDPWDPFLLAEAGLARMAMSNTEWGSGKKVVGV